MSWWVSRFCWVTKGCWMGDIEWVGMWMAEKVHGRFVRNPWSVAKHVLVIQKLTIKNFRHLIWFELLYTLYAWNLTKI